MVIGQVERRIPCQFNLHFSSVCPHPFSDQSGQAEHPLDWGFECSQQSLLLCSHCQHKESDNGELSVKKTFLTWKRFQTYLTCLACLEGGVGNIVSRCNCHFIPNFPVLCFTFDSRWNKYKNTEIWWNCPSLYSRSMLAQLVPQRELGKVYGLLAILDAALPFIGWPPLFMLFPHNYFSTSPG